MKLDIKGKPPVIIGKRVTAGALIGSFVSIAAHFFPEHAPAFIAASVPLTMVAQIIIANKFGVTSADSD